MDPSAAVGGLAAEEGSHSIGGARDLPLKGAEPDPLPDLQWPVGRSGDGVRVSR